MTNRSGATRIEDCISVQKCPKGYYSKGGIVPCIPCPNGTFANATGTRVCHKCPPGYITRGIGWTGEGKFTCIDGTRLEAAFEVCLCMYACMYMYVCVTCIDGTRLEAAFEVFLCMYACMYICVYVFILCV
jgi:hypothetical protein